jgi:hypothetical protein
MLPNLLRLLSLAFAVASFVALPACSGSSDSAKKNDAPKEAAKQAPKLADKPKEAAKDAPKPAEKKQTMDEAIAALMAKPEQPDESITVQHVLISFQGAGVPNVTRSKDEAKTVAEKVWADAIGGADFKTLMKQSDDTGGGEYPMTKAGRRHMVAAFGDVGFRLKVGEIGVAPFEAQKSPYGWHIIKRVK